MARHPNFSLSAEERGKLKKAFAQRRREVGPHGRERTLTQIVALAKQRGSTVGSVPVFGRVINGKHPRATEKTLDAICLGLDWDPVSWRNIIDGKAPVELPAAFLERLAHADAVALRFDDDQGVTLMIEFKTFDHLRRALDQRS